MFRFLKACFGSKKSMTTMKKSFRPSLESCESRELMTAGLLGSLAPHLPATPVHVQHQPATPTMGIEYLPTTTQKASTPAKTQALTTSAIGFDQTYPDSVITIQNHSRYTVYFYFTWDNTGWSSLQTLAPNHYEYFVDNGAGHNGYIEFQKSVPTRGDLTTTYTWQNTTYRLSSHTFYAGGFADLQPHWTDGQFYTFSSRWVPLDLYQGNF
jgi:hypothetical protein